MDYRVKIRPTEEDEARQGYIDTVKRTAAAMTVGVLSVAVVGGVVARSEADAQTTVARDIQVLAAGDLGDLGRADRSDIEAAVELRGRQLGLLLPHTSQAGDDEAEALACGIVDAIVLQGNPGATVVADPNCFD